MKTNVPDIYGAGDVTSFPLSIRGGQKVQIGHWQMAHSHGNTTLPVHKPWFHWVVIDGYIEEANMDILLHLGSN